MKLENRFPKALLVIAYFLLFIFTACSNPGSGQSKAIPTTNQGFLSSPVRDVFALIGFFSVVVKIASTLISSVRNGLARSFYTRYLLPFLLSHAYEQKSVNRVNHLLENIALSKLNSNEEEKRMIGVKELAGMPPSHRIFHALVLALNQERSKPLRREIVRAITLHVNYELEN